jgi:hypothetical protein
MLRLVFNTSSNDGDAVDSGVGDGCVLLVLPLLQPDNVKSAIAAQRMIFLYIMLRLMIFGC